MVLRSISSTLFYYVFAAFSEAGEKTEQATKGNNSTAPEKAVEKPEGKEQRRTRNSKPSPN